MSKYLETLHNYFNELFDIEDLNELYKHWKNAPVLSSNEFYIWLEQRYVERSDYELSLEYGIADHYNLQPDYFRVKTKISTYDHYDYESEIGRQNLPLTSTYFKKLSPEEEKKSYEEFVSYFGDWREEKPELFIASKFYKNSPEDLETLIHDFKSLENILNKKIKFKVVFLLDNQNYLTYFHKIFSSEVLAYNYYLNEHFLLKKSTYERELIKIELLILGVYSSLFNWVFKTLPELVRDSNGILIREWDPKYMEGRSKSR